MWTGAKDKELGLVDELGGLDKALEMAIAKEMCIRDSSRTIRTVVCSNHSVTSGGVCSYTAIDAALPFIIGWHRIDITIIYRCLLYTSRCV